MLVGLAFGLTEQVKRIWPKLPPAGVQAVPLLTGIGSVVLLAHSTFGHSQLIGTVPLDTLNGAAQAVVGLMLGGVATGVDKLVGKTGAIANIGENQPSFTPGPAGPPGPPGPMGPVGLQGPPTPSDPRLDQIRQIVEQGGTHAEVAAAVADTGPETAPETS